jgi:putative endopeptidase
VYQLMKTVLVSLTASCVLAAGSSAQQSSMRAVNRADIDTTCKPCQNFYKFATGGWERRTPIPAAYPSWSSFDELTQRNYEVVRGILETAAREADATSDADRRRLGRFYRTCMDSTAVEARGLQPLGEGLDRIDRVRTRAQLREEIARLHRVGTPILFGFGSQQDAMDSRRVIFAVTQGGLGLPDRDYYFRTDSATQAIGNAYLEYVTGMLRLLGAPAAGAQARAAQVLALEVTLATPSLNRLQLRDPKTQYHMMPVVEADRLTPTFSWRGYLRGLGVVGVDSFNVSHPEFFRTLARELETRPIEEWKSYLRFHLANDAAPWLSSAFVNQRFAFTSKLTGARELQPRWRRCLAASDRLLGDALGKEYVKVAYTPEAKSAMDAIIDNLMVVYRRRLQAMPWMGEDTRREALRKLATFGRKIGYPDKWRDYTALDVRSNGWFENARRAVAFENRWDLDKVGKPVDRGEWVMTPPTVNAYYSPPNNEIAFPAGRLQPPFFHPTFDLAANYGGIGATIGHEISHGFDDQGRKYDAEGNLRDWWTADDATRFAALAERLERQYSGYTVLGDLRLKGQQTLGENIADNGGVAIAFEALQLALEGQPRTLIDGYTPEQRFFLGWAQARRTTWRDPALRLQVQTGVHSPGEFRVNGPLSNMPEFAAAWGCTAGDPMVRAEGERNAIW